MWCVEQVLNLTLQLAKSSCPSYSTPLSFSFFLGKVKIIPSTLYHLRIKIRWHIKQLVQCLVS